MTDKITDAEIAFADAQVTSYFDQYHTYEQYAILLEKVLKEVTRRIAPDSIVQARPKTVSSFAGKIWRKWGEVKDPVNEFTDLCGARVIAHDQDGVSAVCDYIKDHFKVDYTNSVTIEQRLKPSEFGYRSIHYIVQFKENEPGGYFIKTPFPEEIYALKAEIQVRTLLEHSWADFNHSISYKKSFLMPDKWTREMAKFAALIEVSDSQLIRVKSGLGHYLSSYRIYMTKDQIEQEIIILGNVLRHDKGNLHVALEIAHLNFELERWEEAERVLEPLFKDKIPSAMRDYGIALCNRYSANKDSDGYREGQRILHDVVEQYPKDLHAICSLAASYRNINEYTAENYYKQAFELAPDNPYPLSYYLDYFVSHPGSRTAVASLFPIMRRAYRKSRELADADLDVPWSYFNMGKFSLLMNKKDNAKKEGEVNQECDAVYQYAKALQSAHSSHPVITALNSLNLFAPGKEWITGYLTVCTLLKLGLDTKFSKARAKNIPECCPMIRPPLRGPVIIIAGNTGQMSDSERNELYRILAKGFKNFTGTIIGGGTTAGVSGLVGDLQEKYKGILTTGGYYPEKIPMGKITVDTRYESLRNTPLDHFSALEAAQYWTDIIGSGISPANVRVIGIGGGEISAAEYRMALALGAQVGVLDGGGGAAEALFEDKDWRGLPGIVRLLRDGETIRAFITKDICLLTPKEREEMAIKNHAYYQKIQGPGVIKTIPSLYDWEKLDKGLQESNRKWVDHTSTKLREFGYFLKKSDGKKFTPVSFSEEEIDVMAEMEHARWTVERIREGWHYGEKKDVEKKISPYLVPWDQLTKEVKDWDRDPIIKLPALLAEMGYEIYK
ncbi:MAG: RyR domain-containing protein [Methanoregula sp.]|jgi:ppGpp synthetase/RelA/SpoT-type nucleotidyltranferase